MKFRYFRWWVDTPTAAKTVVIVLLAIAGLSVLTGLYYT